MVKRTIALIFILLANIVLLAHAVVPHHHHQSVTCIEKTHIENDKLAHNYDCSTNNHENDGPLQYSNCILKQAVIIPSSQAKLLKNCYKCSDCQQHDFYVLYNFEFENIRLARFCIIKKSEFTFTISSFLSTFLGLRAPPIV